MNAPLRHRALSPARLSAAILDAIAAPNPPRYQVGDLVTFEKDDGHRWQLVLLGFDDDRVDAMFWDGRPRHLPMTIADLNALRITKVEPVADYDLRMYRQMLGLDEATGSVRFEGDGIYQFTIDGRQHAYLVVWNAETNAFELRDRTACALRRSLSAEAFDSAVIGRLVEFEEEAA